MPVQFLPQADSFGSRFGDALRSGLQKSHELRSKVEAEEKLLGQKTKSQMDINAAKQTAKEAGDINKLKTLFKLLKGEMPEGIIDKDEMLQEEGQGTSPAAKSLLSEEPSGIASLEKAKTSTKKTSDNLGENWETMDPAIKAFVAQEYPQVASQLQKDLEFKQRQSIAEREFGFKSEKEQSRKQEALRAETLPVRKELAEKGRLARQGIESKQQLIDLIDKGNLDDPTWAAVAQAIPLRLGERMLSPDTVTYRAGIIDEYKDLRSIFQGQTRMKEIDLLEDKIAGLYLTDEQKKAILKSRINALQADIIKADVAAELEAEGKFGGLAQFEKMVEERSRPRLEGVFNRVLDENKAILQDAENRKKIPLDPRDPESAQIMKQILQEAGGNKEEAKRIAKKKGYTVIGTK